MSTNNIVFGYLILFVIYLTKNVSKYIFAGPSTEGFSSWWKQLLLEDDPFSTDVHKIKGNLLSA